MLRTVSRMSAILALWSCMSMQSLAAVPAAVQLAYARPAADANALYQHWVRSTEEEQAGSATQVFRPAASKVFPPSRFRMAYKFARGGSCEYYFLSPDDAHRFKPCRWTLVGGDGKSLQVMADGATTSYRIVELSVDVLRLMPLESRGTR